MITPSWEELFSGLESLSTSRIYFRAWKHLHDSCIQPQSKTKCLRELEVERVIK